MSPTTHGRGADPRLQGRSRRARRDLRGPARRAEPQPRDGRAPAPRGAAVGRLLPLAGAARHGPRMRVCSPNRASSWAWARPPTRSGAPIADLRNVGVDILTLGQYLRPSRQHLPVARWWTPEEFAELGAYAEGLGFAPRRGRARSCAPATTPSEPRAPPPPPPVGRDVHADRARRGARGAHAASSASTCCCCRPAPTCPTSPATRRCRSSGSPCWSCRPTRDAVLVVPRARGAAGRRAAGRVRAAPRGTRPTTRSRSWPGWSQGIDPDVTSAAIGDHTWARFVLDLQAALPDVAFRRAIDVTGPLRVVKDAAEIDALRAAATRRRRRRRRDARPARSPAAPSSTCTASSSSACSTAATSAPTSPSSPPAPTPPARTTTRATA